MADVAERFGLAAPVLTGRRDPSGRAADVLALGRLLASALAELGVEPDVTAGHGPGEWAAMIAAGMCGEEAADVLAALEPDDPDLACGALGCGADRADEAVGSRPGVFVSHDNCPHQSVICGPAQDVRDVLERLESEGVLGRELPLRLGLHTPHAESREKALRRAFDALASANRASPSGRRRPPRRTPARPATSATWPSGTCWSPCGSAN
ncbi:hypothetical protein [Actinomadura sp. CNU-125]|uniref:hypothetical protein n=1 Tax=Actinomadura sp. CNU-125 TaxID=1904961 RepID=UPI000AE92389|nr:hypothetical protein [Actinomadura sp. CNU-125]